MRRPSILSSLLLPLLLAGGCGGGGRSSAASGGAGPGGNGMTAGQGGTGGAAPSGGTAGTGTGGGGRGAASPVPITFKFMPLAISGDGSVVVGRDFADPSRAMRWTAAAGVTFLGRFDPHALSTDGTTMAGEATNATGIRQAVRLTDAAPVPLPYPRPQDTNSQVGAISRDGAVIAGDAWGEVPVYTTSVAFRWTAVGGTEALPFLTGDDASQVRGMSPNGEFIVGVSHHVAQRRSRPFRWTKASGSVELAALPGSSLTLPIAVNDAGIVIGEAFAGGTVDFASVSGATSRQPIVWLAGQPAVSGDCGALQSTNATIASNAAATILGACGQSRLFLTSPRGSTRVLPVPPIPAGYTADQQRLTPIGLSGDGTTVVGRRELDSLGGSAVSVLVWPDVAALPLDLPATWTTAAGAQVGSPWATAMSDDGSTLTGYASDQLGWVARLR